MDSEVHKYYGNKLRVRVCGICQLNDTLLLINHSSITETNFWAPPGGGLNFSEQAEECLIREFLEETGIQIRVENFLFACELIKHPLHAIELFFMVTPLTLELKTGIDPESESPDIIREVVFKSWDELQAIPKNEIHGIFSFVDRPSEVGQLRGYFKL